MLLRSLSANFQFNPRYGSQEEMSSPMVVEEMSFKEFLHDSHLEYHNRILHFQIKTLIQYK